ncbi:MAG: hypothetical protein DHS20C01_16860 [marine bacterium B5-7]|nr:MAG: hypothetical protein DHS20C01_16860 [marine bacterium B5-7]
MEKLTREDLYSLEQYSKVRNEFRSRVIEHKKPRRVSLGPNLNVYFEDRLTMQYQVQEMLRIERIFEAEAIDEELDTYNPLIPDGNNLKATMMIEYDDIDARRVALGRLIGIEGRIWIKVEGFDKVYAIADEDLGRSNDSKTSAVHFLRFELGVEASAAARAGAAINIGVDHDEYRYAVEPVDEVTRASLAADLG